MTPWSYYLQIKYELIIPHLPTRVQCLGTGNLLLIPRITHSSGPCGLRSRPAVALSSVAQDSRVTRKWASLVGTFMHITMATIHSATMDIDIVRTRRRALLHTLFRVAEATNECLAQPQPSCWSRCQRGSFRYMGTQHQLQISDLY